MTSHLVPVVSVEFKTLAREGWGEEREEGWGVKGKDGVCVCEMCTSSSSSVSWSVQGLAVEWFSVCLL